MRAPGPGVVAAHLPWLSPCATSLVALARGSVATAWAEVRTDPGAVLLLLRSLAVDQAPSDQSFVPRLLNDPAVLERAVCQLEPSAAGFVDWTQPGLLPIYQGSLTIARLATVLAEQTRSCDPDHAWVAGLLAPLGWLAVSAIDAEAACQCLADPELKVSPAATQQRRWGLDQAGIARRLARRWRLPRWLAAGIGYLDLPAETAQTLGANLELFQVVQLAVALAQQHGLGLRLGVGTGPKEMAVLLGISAGDLGLLERDLDSWKEALSPAKVWSEPGQPLLRDLLILAAENRRLTNSPMLESLENEVDLLQQALQEQRSGEEDRLQQRKLTALAEFAGGAGHEINNPLAVISGQAQYLLNHEPDPGRQRALQAIIGQAKRIHQTLGDLMQFARPARPQKQKVDVAGLVLEVAAAVADLAGQRGVQIICPPAAHPIVAYADPLQLRNALASLLRNAVEAAPAEGWAGVRLETPASHRVDIIVEDNGPGPDLVQRPHLFDPFYSGRSAGRGRGLGLPTAWRLAQEQGGDVRFVDNSGGPTRFVLSLPREPGTNGTAANGCCDRLSPVSVTVNGLPQE